MILTKIKQFFQLGAISGILLFIAAIFAMLAHNFIPETYHYFTHFPISIQIDNFSINKPSELWINDGLMALFFFVIGLELKREVLAGELRNPKVVMLPIIGAMFGMIVPALIYFVLNADNAIALKGWAIPAATDIAFALGVLLLLGKRVPYSLKIFLLTLAIIDDIGAILIIAIFYTQDINTTPLIVAILATIVLFILNKKKVLILSPYIFVGIILWVAMLKSGVHATIAGVILAMFIPYISPQKNSKTLLEQMEHDLHPLITYVTLPLFAFVNMGIPFSAFTISNLLNEVSLGIILGLFIGKQLGIFIPVLVITKLGFAKLPEGATYMQIYGVCALCGIGFTMSLFIGQLAFFGHNMLIDERLGIVIGSLLSAIVGYLVLRFAPLKKYQH